MLCSGFHQSTSNCELDGFGTRRQTKFLQNSAYMHFDRVLADEAQEIIMNVIYKLIKEDPTLDIYTELTKAQEEYNANN